MRILVADDDRTTTTILSTALGQWDFEVSVAHDGNAAWQQLQSVAPPSLVVVDWMMPGLDGIEICRRLRSTPRLAGLYAILLTSREGRASLVEGLDAGADDYMVKPIDLEELRARVHVGIRVAGLQRSLTERLAELQATRDRLARLASTDMLTELYSRRGWFDLASTEFSRCRRYARTFSLLTADLDFFKQVNDRFGHAAGDDVLRRFAEMLRTECRQSDIIGRLGGEEFAIMLPESASAAAQSLAARVTDACRRLSVETPAGAVQTSCSIGVTQLRGDDQSIADVMRRSDAALYEAKRSGRDRWRHAA